MFKKLCPESFSSSFLWRLKYKKYIFFNLIFCLVTVDWNYYISSCPIVSDSCILFSYRAQVYLVINHEGIDIWYINLTAIFWRLIFLTAYMAKLKLFICKYDNFFSFYIFSFSNSTEFSVASIIYFTYCNCHFFSKHQKKCVRY